MAESVDARGRPLRSDPRIGGAQLALEFARPVKGPLTQAVLLSLLPAAFWLWYVTSSSPRSPRKSLLALALLAGAASTQLVLALGWVIDEVHPEWTAIPSAAWAQLLFFVVNVGLVEEFSKLLAVRFTVYGSADFQEPWDGLMYSAASALGFATAENVTYVLGFGDPSVLLGRSLLSTFGHVLMSACWGYSLGLQKSQPGRYRLLTFQGLIWASLGHGTFDFCLMQGQSWLAVGVLASLFWLYRLRLVDSVLESRHRIPHARLVRECPACRALVRSDCSYCTGCGRSLSQDLPLHCGRCLSRLEGPGVCPNCQATASGSPG